LAFSGRDQAVALVKFQKRQPNEGQSQHEPGARGKKNTGPAFTGELKPKNSSAIGPETCRQKGTDREEGAVAVPKPG